MSAFTPAQREMLDIIPFALAETSYFVTELKVRPFAVISGRKPMMEICSTNIRRNCFTATRHQILGPNGAFTISTAGCFQRRLYDVGSRPPNTFYFGPAG